MYCVDTWLNDAMPQDSMDTYPEFSLNVQGVDTVITAIRKRSDRLIREDVPGNIRLVFIDGDHEYACVSEDFRRLSAWLEDDGVIAFHDYSVRFSGVCLAVGEALAEGRWIIAGQVESLIWLRPYDIVLNHRNEQSDG